MYVDFSNLDLIPKLLEELQILRNDLALLQNKNKIDLSKLYNVAKFLNVSKPTIYNMIDDGRFQQNVHYKKQINQNKVRIVFVESAIIKYKKESL